MSLLIAGVVFWSIAHLVPAAAPGFRADLAGKFGEGPYKGLFTVDIVIALALIIFGWKAATPAAIYVPPMFDSPVPTAFLIMAVLLFVASITPNNLKRYIRHPQMFAVIFWGIGHLLSNGDSRSVVLFGGFIAWAILEIIFINKRDGDWKKPESVGITKDIVTAVFTAAVFATLLYFHASLFGVSPIAT
jgi:uncharacterized membrane protein